MAEPYLIDENDRRLIQEALNRLRRGPLSPANRPTVPEPVPITGTPEVYVVMTPPGGVAGMTGAQTGTGSPTIGSASAGDCNVYQLIYDGVTAELFETGESITAFNLSPHAAPGSSWAIAARDKYGAWWILAVASDCDPVAHTEVDIRCEGGKLNLYERRVEVTINSLTGCQTREELPFEFVRTVACCDDTCAELRWYCIDYPDTGTGTGSDQSSWYCFATVGTASSTGSDDLGTASGTTIDTNSECLLLTEVELEELVASGRTMLGGPFTNEQICDAACSNPSYFSEPGDYDIVVPDEMYFLSANLIGGGSHGVYSPGGGGGGGGGHGNLDNYPVFPGQIFRVHVGEGGVFGNPDLTTSYIELVGGVSPIAWGYGGAGAVGGPAFGTNGHIGGTGGNNYFDPVSSQFVSFGGGGGGASFTADGSAGGDASDGVGGIGGIGGAGEGGEGGVGAADNTTPGGDAVSSYGGGGGAAVGGAPGSGTDGYVVIAFS